MTEGHEQLPVSENWFSECYRVQQSQGTEQRQTLTHIESSIIQRVEDIVVDDTGANGHCLGNRVDLYRLPSAHVYG